MPRPRFSILPVVLFTAVTLFAGCEAKELCERQYGQGVRGSCPASDSHEAEVMACRAGAEDIAGPRVRNENEELPSGPPLERFCEQECQGRYGEGLVPLGNDPRFAGNPACVTDLSAACKTSCMTAVNYEQYRRMEEAERPAWRPLPLLWD